MPVRVRARVLHDIYAAERNSDKTEGRKRGRGPEGGNGSAELPGPGRKLADTDAPANAVCAVLEQTNIDVPGER